MRDGLPKWANECFRISFVSFRRIRQPIGAGAEREESLPNIIPGVRVRRWGKAAGNTLTNIQADLITVINYIPTCAGIVL